MEKFTHSKWFYLTLSLFFALLLYFNANNSGSNDGSNVTQEPSSSTTSESTEVVSNLPIHLTYDKSKYFVSVSTNTVSVTLTSMNRVLLDAEANKQTRTFKAQVDLTKYGPGTYTVPIKLKGLDHAIEGRLSQKEVEVTIDERASRTFKVETNISQEWVKKGLEISKITLDPKEVTVSTAKSDLDKISHIVAYLSPQQNIEKSFTTRAKLKAYSMNGEEIVADFSDDIAEVSVDIESPKKTAKLNLIQKGTMPKKISSYQFLCDTQDITIEGKKDSLSKISSLDVPIDIQGVDKTVTRQVHLNLPKGIKSDTKTITVTIVPQLSRD